MKKEMKRLHQRRKVNCICRCTPKQGIIALHPDYAQRVFDEQLRRILLSGNPGFIADLAIRTGNILRQASRPQLALKLMQTALKHLINVDEEMQRDYASKHYWPRQEYQHWYHPWSARVSEVDARQLATEVDKTKEEISQHLGCPQRYHMRYHIHRIYERIFEDIYEV